MESSSRAVACGTPPFVHCAISPAPTKISGGTAAATSMPDGCGARLPIGSVVGPVSPAGEPPHDRPITASDASIQNTARFTRAPLLKTASLESGDPWERPCSIPAGGNVKPDRWHSAHCTCLHETGRTCGMTRHRLLPIERGMSNDINGNMSLIKCERRVLEEARDDPNPLLERVKFLGILGRNLDEFVMARGRTWMGSPAAKRLTRQAHAPLRDGS